MVVRRVVVRLLGVGIGGLMFVVAWGTTADALRLSWRPHFVRLPWLRVVDSLSCPVVVLVCVARLLCVSG